MNEPRYIVVDGPIGAGKTSFAKLLAEEIEARLVLESIDENPFLTRFYEEPRRYALAAQIEFLLARYEQQQELAKPELFAHNVVADYSFAKDSIFARLNLDEDEQALYQKLFAMFEARVRKPDLVVYLQARVDVLLARVRKRAKQYERRITPQYIETVGEAYRQHFFHYDDTPLLVVNCSDIDFVTRPEDFDDLVRKVLEMGPGVQHYIPLGSK